MAIKINSLQNADFGKVTDKVIELTNAGHVGDDFITEINKCYDLSNLSDKDVREFYKRIENRLFEELKKQNPFLG